MSLSSKEIADFFKWTSWNTKEKKKGWRKEGRNKTEKEEGKQGGEQGKGREEDGQNVSFGAARTWWAFLVVLYCLRGKGYVTIELGFSSK